MKILFVTVGMGIRDKKDSLAGSILKSISDQNPDYTVFLCTKDSTTTAQRVIELSENRLKFEENCKIYEDIDKEDINEAFNRIYTIMKEIVNEMDADSIVVNYTSGTKTMSVAAALAGILFKSDFIYVAVKKNEKGEPIPGTEKVIHLSPYSFMDEDTLKKISSYFSRYYIFTALELVSRLVSFPHRVCLKKVLEGYMKWNLFEYDSAYEILSACDLNEVGHIFKDVNRFKKNIQFLKACKGATDENLELKDLRVKYAYILVDVFLNAERTFEIGKYDDAVARLYRVLELIAQTELLRYGYRDPISEDSVKEEHKGIFMKYLTLLSGKEYRLPLYKKMELLKEMDSNVGKRFIEDDKIKTMLQYRNFSFLAHGFKPVNREMAREMMELVEEYIEISLKNIPGVKFEKIKEMGKFPTMVWREE